MQVITSTIHARVTVTPPSTNEPVEVVFPAEIGDGAGQVPQAAADVLLSLATVPGEYEIEGEPDEKPAKKTKASDEAEKKASDEAKKKAAENGAV